MEFNKEGKRFGLEIRQKKPPKQAPPLKKAAPIFGNDDDDEDEGSGGPQGRGVERDIARQAASKKFNKEVSSSTSIHACRTPVSIRTCQGRHGRHRPPGYPN